MRTTINIKEDIIKKVIQLTGAKNTSRAINEALDVYIRERQIKSLLDLRGRLHLEDNWKKLREMELDEG